MASHWRRDYVSALEARDRNEKGQKTLYDAYTKLADRTSAIGLTHLRNTTSSSPSSAHNTNTTSPQRAEDTLTETRRDLIEAQRSRALLQTRVDDTSTSLQRLKLQSSVERKRLDELTQEKLVLSQRLRDRDEELRGKAKLLEDVHDETVSLTLQLNMAEDRAQKLRDENENLVKRWMERMGKEADAMNEASRFT
ncbi:MAG: hypothetical protein LQ350_003134 [Teloschistes chrysophthalmus]|nr:MAG: hypothetical protein LQ350_003134 [Niorma chrysophthalma]